MELDVWYLELQFLKRDIPTDGIEKDKLVSLKLIDIQTQSWRLWFRSTE